MPAGSRPHGSGADSCRGAAPFRSAGPRWVPCPRWAAAGGKAAVMGDGEGRREVRGPGRGEAVRGNGSGVASGRGEGSGGGVPGPGRHLLSQPADPLDVLTPGCAGGRQQRLQLHYVIFCHLKRKELYLLTTPLPCSRSCTRPSLRARVLLLTEFYT